MEELHSFKAGAFLPGVQAFLSGVFFSLLVAGVAWWTGTQKAGVFLLVGGSFVAFVAWVVLLRHWVRLVDTVYHVQPAHQNIQVLEPAPSSVKVTLLEEKNGAFQGEYLSLPCAPEQLRLLASGVVEGAPLSEGAWCGSGKPFTKSQFHQLRDELLRRGWFQWRNQKAPAQGVECTLVGRRVFCYLAEGTLPHQAAEDW